MSRYSPNTLIDGRYQLVENISYDSKSGRQVWAAKDNQTSKRLIGRFQSNGSVEWFDDTRPVVSTPPKVIAAKPTPVITVPSSRQLGKFNIRSFYPLLIFVGAALIAIGYYRKEELQVYFKRKTNTWKLSAILKSQDNAGVMTDSTAVISTDTTSFVENSVEHEPEISAKEKPVNIQPVAEPKSDNKLSLNEMKWSAREAASRLNRLNPGSFEDHKPIFDIAKKTFVNFRLTSTNTHYIDSLYIVYAGRGAQSLQILGQNGDRIAKKYAIEWYSLAYSLKPSSSLKERIDRLLGSASKRYIPKKNKIKEHRESLFMKDPELNQ